MRLRPARRVIGCGRNPQGGRQAACPSLNGCTVNVTSKVPVLNVREHLKARLFGLSINLHPAYHRTLSSSDILSEIGDCSLTTTLKLPACIHLPR